MPVASAPDRPLPDPLVGEQRNLLIALILSLLAHGALLAIKASSTAPAIAPAATLEVTLVNTRTEAAPIAPQVVAQQDVNAGGNANQGVAASPLPFTSADAPDEVVLEALRKRQQQLEQEQLRLLHQLESQEETWEARNRPDLFQDAQDPGDDNLEQDSAVLSARIAALKDEVEQYNKRPRQHFVGPSAQAVDYAEYVEAWREKVELLGTQHYPPQARGKVYGSLQLTVYIDAQGQLLRVEIDRPSEHAILNAAARRIVQLAAPFAPLPPALAAKTDVLAITRTWHFTRKNTLSTDSP